MTRTPIAIACCAALTGAAALTTASLGAAATTTTKLYAKMSGKQEVPAGDPDGRGTATLTILKSRRVHYVIRPSKAGTTFSAGHIHLGRKGKSGAVFITLFDKPKKTSGGLLRGDSQVVSRSNLNKIATHPGDYYVNIHNAAFPSGAIRGQPTKTKPS